MDACDDCEVSDLDTIPTQELFFQRPENEAAQGHGRFGDALNREEQEGKIKGAVPKRTQSSNNWAVKVFSEWRTWRQFQFNTRHDENWPIPMLERATKVSL